MGLSQEALAERLGTDRSTIARWERGESEPQPHVRPKLGSLLGLSPLELETLLKHDEAATLVQPNSGPAAVIGNAVLPGPDLDPNELDDMNRRELLRMLSVAGAPAALPNSSVSRDVGPFALAPEVTTIEQFGALNIHLWRVFALSSSKRAAYPLVRQQLAVLIEALERPHSDAEHAQLCALTGDLCQLAGEICFDGNRYTDAAYCYTLAASACKEADAHDLWACALTRHAFIEVYDQRFAQASSMLTAAERIALRGDTQLATRHWVAAVQAKAFAGLGDMHACERALETAEGVWALPRPAAGGGWLRFDRSRLAEERGSCYVTLGRIDRAEFELSEALSGALSPRRRGGVLINLAIVGTRQRDVDKVMEYGGAALDVAERTHSVGYIGRKMLGLQAELAHLPADDRVTQLRYRISLLAGTA